MFKHFGSTTYNVCYGNMFEWKRFNTFTFYCVPPIGLSFVCNYLH